MGGKYFHSRWFLAAGGVMIGLVLVSVGWLFLRPHTYAGTLFNPPKLAYAFDLTGPGGKPVQLADLKGKWLLVFFGYTSCPDVCPTTMHDLEQVASRLGAQSSRVEVVFISVDPDRDTPERLQSYLSRFQVPAVGLTGTLPVLSKVAEQYGVFFQKMPADAKGNYEVDHTAVVQVIDPDGNLRLLYTYPVPVDGMAGDLRYLFSH